MIRFIFLILILFSTNSFSWVAPDNFKSSIVEIEQQIYRTTLDKKLISGVGALDENIIKNILNDHKGRIKKDFKIDPYFKTRVNFWFRVYTQYSSDQVIIHDKENFDLIYNIIDFKDIKSSKLNRYVKSKLQSQLSLEYTRKLKASFKIFSNKLTGLNESDRQLLKKLRTQFKIPRNKKKRKRFFIGLAKNLRTQTGQRDMIQRGIVRSIPYFPYLEEKIKLFNIPRELLAIPFLESSFNPKAYSKVGAAGAWQFMPFIASLFMPRRSKHVDYRLNIFVSSLSAFNLLRENKMILKRWDLAVTAYNSGTKHLLRARKKLRKRKRSFTLPNVLRSYNHAHLGFASKNFYSEFLALVHVLAYKNDIYPLKGYEKEYKRFNSDRINFYLTKCSFTARKIGNLLKKTSPQFNYLNTHFMSKNKMFGRGHILVSDVNLTKRKYVKVSDKVLKKYRAKDWFKKLRTPKCGKL
jgi:membrane-bound lytic murein transglycosylase D